MKNQPKTLKTYKTDMKPWKSNLKPWKTMKTNLEMYRVVMGGYWRLPGGKDHFSWLHHNIYITTINLVKDVTMYVDKSRLTGVHELRHALSLYRRFLSCFPFLSKMIIFLLSKMTRSTFFYQCVVSVSRRHRVNSPPIFVQLSAFTRAVCLLIWLSLTQNFPI